MFYLSLMEYDRANIYIFTYGWLEEMVYMLYIDEWRISTVSKVNCYCG